MKSNLSRILNWHKHDVVFSALVCGRARAALNTTNIGLCSWPEVALNDIDNTELNFKIKQRGYAST